MQGLQRTCGGILVVAVVASMGAARLHAAPAAKPKMAVGDCVRTRISSIGTRLEDGATHQPVAGSGSAVSFGNGLYQVSYEDVAEITRATAGDPVSVCLLALPRSCPPGDDRGKLYQTTDLRTHDSWTLPDAEHMCGGA